MKKIEIIRHSLSHILAYAVQELYPGTKFGIGPAVEELRSSSRFANARLIENGFYYDFELPKTLTPQDLPKIEKKMRELIKQNIAFKKREMLKSDFNRLFKGQPYKLELIKELADYNPPTALPSSTGPSAGPLRAYQVGNFIDLCKGPHVKSTLQLHSGKLKEIIDAFKLTKIAGAYWRGSERNPMLTRIYGLAFEKKKELDKHLLKEAEAEKRDHRVLGQKLELFLFDEEVGAGLPIWQPKGTILRKIIEDYLYKELSLQGYQWIVSPHIGNLKLWKTSGHWDLYRENMYSPIKIDEEEYMLKPMNCPFHAKIYKSKIRSYKDLPLKYAEFGTVYRYEKSGVLHGLTRVRGFTQDDAHIMCKPDQLNEEITKLLKTAFKILKTFGFKDFDIYLSTRPEKYAGTLKDWEKATNVLKYALKKLKLKWQEDLGGGVFYGPKIDIKIKDSLGRPWQCTTIQVDFNLPNQFQMAYINQKGKKEKPIMIHRALLGSIERFIGVLLEHYSGSLPFWLAPVQFWVIPLGSRHEKYANQISAEIKENDFRVEVKNENETVSKKIREGEIQKIPYLLVVGDKEIQKRAVRVRERGKGDIGLMQLNKFLAKIK